MNMQIAALVLIGIFALPGVTNSTRTPTPHSSSSTKRSTAVSDATTNVSQITHLQMSSEVTTGSPAIQEVCSASNGSMDGSSPIFAEEESTVTYTCRWQTNGNCNHTIFWKQNDTVLSAGHRIHVHQVDYGNDTILSTLTVRNTTLGDDGNITCSLENYTQTSHLTMQEKPRLKIYTHASSVEVGQSITMQCKVMNFARLGHFIHNITWCHNGQLTSSNLYNFPSVNWTGTDLLVLTNISMDANGTYECGIPRSPDSECDFSVSTSSIITAYPKVCSASNGSMNGSNPIFAEEESTVTYTCRWKTNGNCNHTIFWKQNDTVLSAGHRIDVHQVDYGNDTISSTLTVRNTTLGDDGKITCSLEDYTQTSHLTMQEKPRLKIYTHASSVEVGQSITMQCKVMNFARLGHFIHNITWCHNGQLTSSNLYNSPSVNWTGTDLLVLTNISMDANGTYECGIPRSPDSECDFSVSTSSIITAYPKVCSASNGSMDGSSPIFAEEESTVTYTCRWKTNGNCNHTIFWKQNDTVLSAGHRIDVHQVDYGNDTISSTLTVRNTTLGDDGKITCSLEDYTQTSHLTMQEKPRLKIYTHASSVEVGQSITMQCKVMNFARLGHFIHNITWCHNGQLTSSNLYNFPFVNWTGTDLLVLTNISMDANGTYKCGIPRFPDSECDFTVSTSSVITTYEVCSASNGRMDEPKYYFAEEESTVNYTCSWTTNGNCNQKIIWMVQNSTVLSAGQGIGIYQLDYDNDTVASTLTLRNISVEDNGNITCSLGNNTQTSYLSVQEKPELQISPESESVEHGGSINITCKVTNLESMGKFMNNISWCHNGEMISNNFHNFPFLNWTGTDELILNNISMDANGTYVCGIPRSPDSECNFTVFVSSVIMTYEVCLASNGSIDGLHNLFPEEGSTVNYTCSWIINGYCNQTITWIQNDTVLFPGQVIDIHQVDYDNDTVSSTLTLRNISLEDTGDITCSLENNTQTSYLSVQETPKLQISPHPESVGHGGSVNITCKVINLESMGNFTNNISWCHDGKVISSNFYNFPSVNWTGTDLLELTNISMEANGTYKCGIPRLPDSKCDFTVSTSSVIKTHEVCLASDSIMNGPNVDFPVEESSVTFNCSWITNGYCNKTITWKLNNTVLAGQRKYVEQHDEVNATMSSTLTFKNITVGDNGIVSCSLENNTQTRNLSVQEKPRLEISSQHLSVEVGGSINITCKVVNFATLHFFTNSISWCHNGVLIPRTFYNRQTANRTGTHYLTLANISSNATGNYTCGISKPKIQDANCSLNVSSSLNIKTHPKVCNISTGNMNGSNEIVPEDSSVMYKCSWKTNGNCGQNIIWTRNGTVLSGGRRIDVRHGKDSNNTISSTLTIRRVAPRDEGIITCSLGNHTHTYYIFVNEKPRLEIHPLSKSVEVGTNVTLKCNITNIQRVNPVYRITWCYEGQPKPSTKSYGGSLRNWKETNELFLNSIKTKDAGIYKCGAQRIHDSGCKFNVSVYSLITTFTKKETKCKSDRTSDNLQWETTPAGQSQRQNCQPGYDGFASRLCFVNGIWDSPNLLNCVKKAISEAVEKLDNLEDGEGNKTSVITDVLESLSSTTATDNTNDEPKLSSGDLDKTTDALDKILDIANTTSGATVINETSFVGVLDNLLSLDNKQTWSNVHKESNESASKILKTVETLGNVIAKSLSSNQTKTVKKNNIELQVARTSESVQFRPEQLDSGRQLEIQLNARKEKVYTAALYSTMSSLLPNNSGSGRHELTSEVLALDINSPGTWVNKSNPVFLYFDVDTFAKENNLTEDYNATCVYWNFTLNDWSADGCSFHNGTCRCTHLTNFAVLMSPAGLLNEADAAKLRIISLIGCSLSVICTVVTIIVFIKLWRYVASNRSKLLLNLCAALTVAYILFLAGIDKTENEYVCTAMTVLMHYFFLSAFCLMLAEGIDILVSVVFVFWTKSRIRWLLLLGWGAPLVAVSVTIGVSYQNEYHADLYCWLTVTNGVIYSFAGPVVGIIAINSIILVCIIRAVYSTKAVMSRSRKQKVVAGVRSVSVLLPTLGITWLFGILSINDDLVAFQYLFAVTNSLQGFFIFLLHVVFNKQIRKGIREKVKRYEMRMQDSRLLSSNQQKSSKTLSTSDERTEDHKNISKNRKQLSSHGYQIPRINMGNQNFHSESNQNFTSM